jgi:hypothetical protein
MYNMDCMDFMTDIPNNYYDLACVVNNFVSNFIKIIVGCIIFYITLTSSFSYEKY